LTDPASPSPLVPAGIPFKDHVEDVGNTGRTCKGLRQTLRISYAMATKWAVVRIAMNGLLHQQQGSALPLDTSRSRPV
ncbi:MAG: hypothetical protein P4M13_12140, partial [Alphaproteobacteria bacterium]|nr:hypothetical protein [Alphaproteobacteria bacterium]